MKVKDKEVIARLINRMEVSRDMMRDPEFKSSEDMWHDSYSECVVKLVDVYGIPMVAVKWDRKWLARNS